ncbi:endonuclease/exonuclease/phosphatase family protein [Mycobacterium sp. shizuoka-1]|uniref:endonuclease/exonuclease/phosphatase family protein n=1 Tax=Mycobacterium sp. shizuoka-1 TaxID=2039281 RepID=UPI001E417046|nr:endonuclease/exonuclease/phosphatase family protein [Mycobacterium sp. shizuoka-1]
MILAVGSPYVLLVAIVGALVAVLYHQRIVAVLTVATLAMSLTIQVTWYYLGVPGTSTQRIQIRVLSSNLRKGQADAAVLVQLAKGNADVITVAELTPEAVQHLKRAGITKAFGYSHLLPAEGSAGIGIWSRYPLTALTVPRHRAVKMPAARVDVPGVRFDPLLASVHVYSPVAGERNTVSNWRIGMTGAKAQLRTFERIAGPAAVIVGGDYNSTPDMRQFRDLLTGGYADAVNQSGAGFAPTYPADTWFPPLLTVDHVLTRNSVATSVQTVTIPGSDHRALLATIEVPVDPTAS